MELNDILTLMDRFDASAATGLTLTEGNFTLSLEKAAVPVAAVSAAPVVPVGTGTAPVPAGEFIHAPLVGTFYASPSPDQGAFAPVGAQIRKGQTVCVLEAMKMMSEVSAGADCVIEEVLVADGELVGFQSPLFRVRLL